MAGIQDKKGKRQANMLLTGKNTSSAARNLARSLVRESVQTATGKYYTNDKWLHLL
jgi:hypothetical protein